jgi:hypothetical protein
MPLRKEKPPRAPVKESEIDAVISKGGSIATEPPKKGKQQNYPLYFMQHDMRQRIDAARDRVGGVKPPSVNEWINEAILEKLKRDE